MRNIFKFKIKFYVIIRISKKNNDKIFVGTDYDML